MSGLRSFLRALDQAGRLARVTKAVSVEHNLAALGWAVRQRQRKATLFDRLDGQPGWRAASHVFADRAQAALAFGETEPELLPALRRRWEGSQPPVEILEEDAPVCAVRDAEPPPFVRMAEHDPSPQLTAVALAHDPQSGRDIVGLVRLTLAADGTITVLDLPHGLAALQRRAGSAVASMAFAIGADPALQLAAAAALGRPQADLHLAGALGMQPIRIARLNGTPVPADAECVIVADIVPDPRPDRAPISTMLGTYGVARNAWRLSSLTVVRRTDPIHAIPDAGLFALATELLVWSHIHNIEGGLDVLDVRCAPSAAGLVAVLKLRPRVQGQAKTALLGALSGVAYWVKLAVGVDEDIDASSLRDVFWSVAGRTHAAVDVGMLDGVRMLHADPSASGPQAGAERIGARWFIDSTMPAVSQPQQRAVFQRAMPRNFASVDLTDHLPDA